jgi:hypothetical protein
MWEKVIVLGMLLIIVKMTFITSELDGRVKFGKCSGYFWNLLAYTYQGDVPRLLNKNTKYTTSTYTCVIVVTMGTNLNVVEISYTSWGVHIK